MKVKGIHHISNLVGHPQNNIDYNTSLLGLRMIKKAVNFDDAYTYHFYYGNNEADNGTIITAFPYVGDLKEGIKGGGQVNSIYYIIPEGSSDFWKRRLNEFKVEFTEIVRFGKSHIIFLDDAGIQNELVEDSIGKVNSYEYNGVTSQEAIKGFYGALLHSTKPEESKNFFKDILGMKLLEENTRFYRFEFESEIGKYLDLAKKTFKRGRLSVGTVHHIALSVDSLDDLKAFKAKVEELGINVSDIRNRDFFSAIYFREPGGTIIELSTKEPTFKISNIDDKAEELYLPEHFEDKRSELLEHLIPVFVKPTKELKVYKYKNKEEYEIYYNHDALLKRINELAKIAKERDLTEIEFNERAELRRRYIDSIKGGVSALVDSIQLEDKDGKLNKIERKK